ncbi:MAG: hypothetical protein WD266_00010 [Balneolales bacterium]
MYTSPKSFSLSCLFLLMLAGLTYGQSGHNHGVGSDHSHSPNDGDRATHMPVDYSFRSDATRYSPPVADEDGFYWWKGNLHTHTLWSDGDQFPEIATQWYYEHGYHFLALSDHNILSRGKKWVNMENRRDVYDLYRERLGDDWIETRQGDDGLYVRLKPLAEVRSLFEQSGRFLMIESEEITVSERIVHVNATNILDYIEPEAAETVEETIRINMNAVAEQRDRTGQEMISHLNHPNFRNAVTAEDMAPVENMRLFEVYNGHRGVLNYGGEGGVKDLDRVWDIVLTKRLGEYNLEPVFGVAVDDAHNYEESSSYTARPGRAWIEVRSRYLTPEHMVRALETGNFIASSGVRVANVRSDGQRYSVSIEPEADVEYTIQFIGTRQGYDPSSQPFVDSDNLIRHDRTRHYSDDIGEILQETTGREASYEFTGDELYVRVRVVSDKVKQNYFTEGEVEKAWLQPLRPGQLYGGSH